jgi:hypothetical protein
MPAIYCYCDKCNRPHSYPGPCPFCKKTNKKEVKGRTKLLGDSAQSLQTDQNEVK